MKMNVTYDSAYQDMLCVPMYDQAKQAFKDYMKSDRFARRPYWEVATALMVIHLTTGALESFVNAVLHLAEAWQVPGFAPITSQEVRELIDCRESSTEKWKWLGRRASNRCVWFDKGKPPMSAYASLVQVRNDLADHDKAPILYSSQGGVSDRRKHVVEQVLTDAASASAIVTVTKMVRGLREAFEAGDASAPFAQPGWRAVWEWACVGQHVEELEILKLAGCPETPISAI